MLGVSKRIIKEELHVRHVAQPQILPHFPSDQAPGALQPLLRVRPSLALTDHTVIDACVPEVTRQSHIRNGHAKNPRVFHDALDRP